MVTKFPRLSDEPVWSHEIFELRRAVHEVGPEARPHEFYYLDAGDWVNVIALTPDGQVVIIEQHRIGTDDLQVEIPGGMVDPGETPLEAARRELMEETGFAAEDWIDAGFVHPNPAIQDNRCHTFVARGAYRAQEQSLEGTEAIDVRLAPLDEVREMITRGEITHALVVCAFYRLFQDGVGSVP